MESVRATALVIVLGLTVAVVDLRGSSARKGVSDRCTRLRELSTRVHDVDEGIALDLLLSGEMEDVLAMQEDVSWLVDTWNAADDYLVQRCFPRADHGIILSAATMEALADGARVVFTPHEAAHLLRLRANVRHRRAGLLACTCEVVSGTVLATETAFSRATRATWLDR